VQTVPRRYDDATPFKLAYGIETHMERNNNNNIVVKQFII